MRLANASGPRLSHNVYVVDLDPAVLGNRRFRARNPNYVEGSPCVYVGMTGLPPGERFQNHKAGVKGNWYRSEEHTSELQSTSRSRMPSSA